MDFALSEEQELFRSAVRKYLKDLGGTATARAVIDGNPESAQTAAAGLAEMGIPAIPVPEDQDGLGLGPLDLVPVFEETGRVLLPGLQLETLALVVPLLKQHGTAAQKDRWLPAIASGESVVSVAWQEPGRSLFPDAFGCTAQKTDQGYTLSGVKTTVPVIGNPDLYLVGASADGAPCLFLVEASGTATLRPLSCLDDTQQLAEITFRDARAELLGEAGKGMDMFHVALLPFHAALSSLMVGGMDELVKMTAEYAKIRVQFNQPIGRFQAIKHRIVDMKLDLETARSLSHYAAWALETGAEDRIAAVHSARAFASRAFIKAAGESIQIHGGIGFTEELDCHLYLKRARYWENYFGSVRECRKAAAGSLGWHTRQISNAVPV